MKTKRFFPKTDQSGETLVEAVIALAVLSLFFTMFALALRSVKIWQRRADELYARETRPAGPTVWGRGSRHS